MLKSVLKGDNPRDKQLKYFKHINNAVNHLVQKHLSKLIIPNNRKILLKLDLRGRAQCGMNLNLPAVKAVSMAPQQDSSTLWRGQGLSAR